MQGGNRDGDQDAGGHQRLSTFVAKEERGMYYWLLLIPVLALGYGFYTQFDRVRGMLRQDPVVEAEPTPVAAPVPAAPVAEPANRLHEPRAPSVEVPAPAAPAPTAVAPAPRPLRPLFSVPAEPVRARTAGKAGLVEALRSGELRLATAGDFGRWKTSHARSGGGNAGRDFNDHVAHMDAYVVQKDFEIPGGLAGAHAVVFLLEPRVPFPRGDAGHSPILDIDSGACIGATCRMLMPQE